MLRPDQVLVMYDGQCPFCTGVAHWLETLDWRDKILCLPYQTRGLPEAVGVTVQRARKTALVLSPSGHLWAAGGSTAAAFDALLPFGLPVFRTLYLVPGVGWLMDGIYSLISRHRSKLPHRSADLPRGATPPTLDPDVEEELARRRLSRQMPSALPVGGRPYLH